MENAAILPDLKGARRPALRGKTVPDGDHFGTTSEIPPPATGSSSEQVAAKATHASHFTWTRRDGMSGQIEETPPVGQVSSRHSANWRHVTLRFPVVGRGQRPKNCPRGENISPDDGSTAMKSCACVGIEMGWRPARRQLASCCPWRAIRLRFAMRHFCLRDGSVRI